MTGCILTSMIGRYTPGQSMKSERPCLWLENETKDDISQTIDDIM